MSELVLASTSPYRRALLTRLGLPFRCEDPGVDEGPLQAQGLAPEDLAVRLARAKAEAVLSREAAGVVVVGSDQVCALGDETLSKPGSSEAAVERLLTLAGREHRLVTAVCVARGDERRELLDVTRLRMRPLTRERAERYVALDDTAQVAGGYKIEQRGIALFERIESADQTAIVGLPLLGLARVLEELGLPAF